MSLLATFSFLAVSTCLTAAAQESKPTDPAPTSAPAAQSTEDPLAAIEFVVDGKPLKIRSAQVHGDDAANLLILSTAEDTSAWKLLPGETKVYVIVRAEWDVPIKVEIKPVLTGEVLRRLWGDNPKWTVQAKEGTIPDFGGAFLVTNTSEEKIDALGGTMKPEDASATGGTVNLKAQTFKRHIEAEFEITFKSAMIKGAVSATRKGARK